MTTKHASKQGASPRRGPTGRGASIAAVPDLSRVGLSERKLPVDRSGEEPSTDTGIEVSGYQSALRLAALRKGAAAGSIASPESTEELEAAIEALRASVVPPRVSRTSLVVTKRRRSRVLALLALATLGAVAALALRGERSPVTQTVSALRARVVNAAPAVVPRRSEAGKR